MTTPTPAAIPEFQHAIKQWLEFGELMLERGCQQGYFSGGGWAAVTLRELSSVLTTMSEAGAPRRANISEASDTPSPAAIAELVRDIDPLRNDAEAMALLKKFRLNVTAYTKVFVVYSDNVKHTSPDLNRAIVECVAKMQQARP